MEAHNVQFNLATARTPLIRRAVAQIGQVSMLLAMSVCQFRLTMLVFEGKVPQKISVPGMKTRSLFVRLLNVTWKCIALPAPEAVSSWLMDILSRSLDPIFVWGRVGAAMTAHTIIKMQSSGFIAKSPLFVTRSDPRSISYPTPLRLELNQRRQH
jgi:hypothetical protein